MSMEDKRIAFVDASNKAIDAFEQLLDATADEEAIDERSKAYKALGDLRHAHDEFVLDPTCSRSVPFWSLQRLTELARELTAIEAPPSVIASMRVAGHELLFNVGRISMALRPPVFEWTCERIGGEPGTYHSRGASPLGAMRALTSQAWVKYALQRAEHTAPRDDPDSDAFIPEASPERRKEILADLRRNWGKTDADVIELAQQGRLPRDSDFATWLVLLDRTDLLPRNS